MSAAYSGLGTGAKAVGNATSSTLSLGFYEGPFSVTQQDIYNGYHTSRFIAGVSTELAFGAGTGALSASARFARAGKIALGVDAATNVVGAGRGVVDISQNGVNFGNVTQVVGSAVGLGGNFATGSKALGELAADGSQAATKALSVASRLRAEVFGVGSLPIVPKRIYLAPAAPRSAVTRSVESLQNAGLKDAHHVIQNAAVRDLPGYDYYAAPGIRLPGPSNVPGTPHYYATQVQRQSGGGTYAAERRIGYKALRRAGISPADARQAIEEADNYFYGLGVRPDSPTRIPGNR